MAVSGEQGQKPQRGIFLRGADGNLYFIPSSQLRSFRLKANNINKVKEALEDVAPKGSNVLAIEADFVLPPRAGECCAILINKLREVLKEGSE